MIPVSAPPRVRDRLRRAPDGPVPVVHRGRYAAYLDVGGWCLGVIGRRATAVPCALRLASDDLGELSADRAHVSDGVLHLDDTPLAVGRIVSVSVPRLVGRRDSHGHGDSHGRSGCFGAPGTTLPSVGIPLGPGEVAGLVGRGDGLTPYGDDVLCGWLAVHRAAGVATPAVDEAVRAALPGTTLLSATLLDCAARGEVIPEFAAYVEALGTAAEAERAATLAAVGHSSGRGLLEGARRALSELTRLPAPGRSRRDTP